MKDIRIGAAAVIVLLGALAAPALAGAEGGLPESALVVVVSRYFNGERAGNGFVVGDGTLVVTNDHLVYEGSEQGDHRLEGLIGVFSPYLGQACDARILASDEELDLAVLEVPWQGHPGLALADANAVTSAPVARVVGLPAVVKRLDNWDADGTQVEAFTPEEQELPTTLASAGSQAPRVVELKGHGRLGPGWSGSPMLAPGTSVAIGCFGSIGRTGILLWTIAERAKGPAACQVPRLLGEHFDGSRLCRADESLKSPEDARDACSLALQASSLLRPDKYASALEPARAFVRLRPESGFGHKMLAYASEHVGQTEAARESYRRAVELDPNSLNGRLLYAQFLAGHGDPNEARQILESLWQAGRSRDLVAIALVSLWGEQKEFSRCLEILEEATKVNPRNVYLWQQMTACRMRAQGPAAAVEPLTRAVELCPERGPLRGSLAHLLETTGALDEAETHFRKLLEVEPRNPVVYYWLAEFLLKHRPQAAAEALQTAEKMLDLPPRVSLPPEKMKELTAEIRRRMESSSEQ